MYQSHLPAQLSVEEKILHLVIERSSSPTGEHSNKWLHSFSTQPTLRLEHAGLQLPHVYHRILAAGT
jgi:hypothetical protein